MRQGLKTVGTCVLGMMAIVHWLDGFATPLWLISLVIFVVAWVGQFIGHAVADAAHLGDQLAHILGARAGRRLIGHRGRPLDQVRVEQAAEPHQHQADGAVAADEVLEAGIDAAVDHLSIDRIEDDHAVIVQALGAAHELDEGVLHGVQGLLLILGVTFISFILMVWFGPDQTYTLIGKNATADQIAGIRERTGREAPDVKT